MGKPAVIEESRPQAEVEVPVSTCQHHWVIETPRGSMSQGRCKRCGEEREFRNSAQDHLWEDDSGSGGGYNPWRGVRPARGAGDDDEVAASSGTRQAMIA
jgi:hypothetical protein